MARFDGTRPTRATTKLLPVRSITSLRETAEARPYLVISPSDLITLVGALFPEKRPVSSSFEKGIHTHRPRTAASSVSGMSALSLSLSIPPPIRNVFDAASIKSTSASSVISDSTTSREPLLENAAKVDHKLVSSFSSTSINQMPTTNMFEEEGDRLRAAIREMSHALGPDQSSGSCHPCAEQWAVLFISDDGCDLSPRMRHDWDDDAEVEDETSSSDSEDDDKLGQETDLDNDYHQLRDAILKLVEDFEIPQVLRIDPDTTVFSNRTSTLHSPRKNRLQRKRSGLSESPQSRNPYRSSLMQSGEEALGNKTTRSPTKSRSGLSTKARVTSASEAPFPVLLTMLEAAEKQCRAQSDFVNAHLYWRTLQRLNQLSSQSLKQDGFASLLEIFSRGPQISMRQSSSAIEEYDAWLIWLKQSQERHDSTIEGLMARLKAVRDKMWYVSDVRNSSVYENARNIAIAMKTMGSQKLQRNISASGARPRNMSRTSANAFLQKTEAQILSMMSATDEHGGPNKLSDAQSELTSGWLSQLGIENFCIGEERIHRLCLEIDTCIGQLLGDGVADGPVLWSSELYHRDKRMLDSGRQKGDLILSGLGTLSLADDEHFEQESIRRGLRRYDFSSTARPSPRDLRSMSGRNGSRDSLASSRWSRGSFTADGSDSQDYFGSASPSLTNDSAATFWSPFQTRSQSPTTSISSVRPRTSSSTNETVIHQNSERTDFARRKFLSELNETLTSLLISDLGVLVFAKGTETDAWFSGTLGRDCNDLKARQEREARKRKTRVIEKKRSFTDLRQAHQGRSQLSDPFVESPIRDLQESGRTSSQDDPTVVGRDVSPLDAEPHSKSATRRSKKRDADPQSFPYKIAFRRLLTMFSVHPSPFTKLNTLYELEQMIVASLTSHRRTRGSRSAATSHHCNRTSKSHTVDPDPDHIHSNGGTMDNYEARRLHALQQDDLSSSPEQHAYQPRTTNGEPSTDMIVEVLHSLFRDPDSCPKTLFRDLQFIASFVPAHILDKTDRGKAFWDAGLAALGLKQDVIRSMVEIADSIVSHHTKHRPGQAAALASPSSAEVTRYSMEDAAQMWTITAKEGDPVAERELAIFYLTHPDLVKRTTLPLSKPSETFKKQVAMGGDEAGRSDPATMCVAYHWMEASSRGGDELAKTYLKQREELNSLP